MALPEALASLPQMARHLRVSTRWLRAETDAGRIPHIKAGDQRLFNVSVVVRLLAERAGTGDHSDLQASPDIKGGES